MSINLDAMLAKRAETLGEGNKFDVEFGGKTFWVVAPELASADWNDEFNALTNDIREDLIDQATAREEFCRLLLADQVDAFVEAATKANIDPFTVLQLAMEEHREQVGKTRPRHSSANTQTRSKRR